VESKNRYFSQREEQTEDQEGIEKTQRVKVATYQPHPGTRLTATVAPFRAWRGLQIVIARGPVGHHSDLLAQEARIINKLTR
jgi:hypothetical protein